MLCSRSLGVWVAMVVALAGCRSASSWSHIKAPIAPLFPHSEQAIADATKSSRRTVGESALESNGVRLAAHSDSASLAMDDEDSVIEAAAASSVRRIRARRP